MTTALTAFLAAFGVSAVITHVMTWLAPRLGAVDRPDGYRKIHTKPIPYLGGIGVYAGFIAPVILLMAWPERLQLGEALWQANGRFLMVLAGSSLALIMGAWDDIRGIRPGAKLLLQAIAAGFGMAGNLVIWRLDLPLVGVLDLGYWGIPLTLFWFLGCMNAINLLDGMDGLAGGVSLIACLTLVAVGHIMGNLLGMLLMACLAGGILGFLVHNFHPARIFMGDSGSNAIGYLIAALALVTSQKSSAAIALLIPILALGVPIIDTSLAMVRRWSQWLPISAPDRKHIHHILLGWGLSQRRAVFVIYGASLLLCAGALACLNQEREQQLMVFGGLAVFLFVAIRVLGAVRLSDVGHRFSRDWQRHHLASQARVELEKLVHRLPHCQDPDAVWAACGPAFEAMGIDEARLTLPGAAPGRLRAWSWTAPGCPADLVDHDCPWHCAPLVPRDPAHGARSAEPGAPNSEPGTRNSELGTPDPEPRTPSVDPFPASGSALRAPRSELSAPVTPTSVLRPVASDLRAPSSALRAPRSEPSPPVPPRSALRAPRSEPSPPCLWQVCLPLDLPGCGPAHLRLAGHMHTGRVMVLHQNAMVWRLRDALVAQVRRLRQEHGARSTEQRTGSREQAMPPAAGGTCAPGPPGNGARPPGVAAPRAEAV